MFLFTALTAFAALARAAHHDVIVGGLDNFTFQPPYVNAYSGDTVTFTFMQKNHTLTQSSFEAPCSPLPYGFDTGFNQVVSPDQVDHFPTVTLTVNDTSPLWYYCKQGDHCPVRGMVFAVNPGDKFEEFQRAATSGAHPPQPAPPPPSESGATPTYPGSASPSHTPADHLVTVGGIDLFVFDPEQVTAYPGDTVTFTFKQKNHTATQSSFNSPCSPLHGGFDSGFMPVANNASEFPTFRVTVNDTKPVWVYCKQGDHCPVRGMVFAINAVESSPNNFAAFKAKATAGARPSGSASVNPQPSGGSSAGNNDNGALPLHGLGASMGLMSITLLAVLVL